MKVTIELEVSNLQDLAGMIAGAADGVLANVAADQEPGKVETAKEVKSTAKKAEPKTEAEAEAKTKPAVKKTEAKTKPAVKKTEAKVETKAKPEPDTESEEKPVHTKAEIKELLTQFCMDNDGGAAKVQAEFKAIGVASLSEASVEQLNTVVAKLGL